MDILEGWDKSNNGIKRMIRSRNDVAAFVGNM
jgi:hypothetical protein